MQVRMKGDGSSVYHVRPVKSLWSLELPELWSYRELLYFLAWRDIKVRYKQTALGAAWAILQPLATCLIFSLVFGRIAKLPSDGIPYPLFAYCGLVPWQFFASTVTTSANSVAGNQAMIQKVFFPRLMLPLSTMLSSAVDLAVSFVVLIGMLVYYGIAPRGPILLLPVFLLLAAATASAAGLWVAALCVRYRDVRFTLSFLTQLWMFATPVVYSSSLLPAKWRVLYALNPMAVVVDGFRWAVFGNVPNSGALLWAGVAGVVAALVTGAAYFKWMEAEFSDII
jgi:homopolymeric O-antigen transport system permease protein